MELRTASPAMQQVVPHGEMSDSLTHEFMLNASGWYSRSAMIWSIASVLSVGISVLLRLFADLRLLRACVVGVGEFAHDGAAVAFEPSDGGVHKGDGLTHMDVIVGVWGVRPD